MPFKLARFGEVEIECSPDSPVFLLRVFHKTGAGVAWLFGKEAVTADAVETLFDALWENINHPEKELYYRQTENGRVEVSLGENFAV